MKPNEKTPLLPPGVLKEVEVLRAIYLQANMFIRFADQDKERYKFYMNALLIRVYEYEEFIAVSGLQVTIESEADC